MATMSRSIVDRLVAGGGWLHEEPDHDAPDNPRAVRIVEYTNKWGGTAYGVVVAGDRDPYRYEVETDFVRSPRLFWSVEEHSDG
jgi:hypothetical protein